MSELINKNLINIKININLKESSDLTNSKILHLISVADSHLNEYLKDYSLTKGINLLSEILNSHLTSNSKQIISIIFTKCFDCFLKSNNQTKCILNFFFKKNKNKFSQLLISKDIIQKLSYEVYQSHSLSRFYILELIKILPNLIINKLELINSVI